MHHVQRLVLNLQGVLVVQVATHGGDHDADQVADLSCVAIPLRLSQREILGVFLHGTSTGRTSLSSGIKLDIGGIDEYEQVFDYFLVFFEELVLVRTLVLGYDKVLVYHQLYLKDINIDFLDIGFTEDGEHRAEKLIGDLSVLQPV